jgi:hypothetical protein
VRTGGLASSRAQRKGFDRVLLYNRLNKKPGSQDHLLNFWLYLWVQDEFGHGCRNVQVGMSRIKEVGHLSQALPAWKASGGGGRFGRTKS